MKKPYYLESILIPYPIGFADEVRTTRSRDRDARTQDDRYAAAPVFFKGVYSHIDYSAKTGGAWVSAKGQPPPYAAGSSRWGMAKGPSCEG